jgi:hypothetical protein
MAFPEGKATEALDLMPHLGFYNRAGGCGGMVDATDLKSVVLLGVRVRVPPSAPVQIAGLLPFSSMALTEAAGWQLSLGSSTL